LEGLAFISTVFNESGALIPFLGSLIRQSVLPSEIILVDGGSTDDTLAVMRDFFKGLKKTPGFEVVTVFEEVKGNSLGPGLRGGNDSAALPSHKEVKGGEKKPGNTDYPHERLVFESIINGVMSVRIYDAPGANISSGRNIAIKNAKSEFICVSDAGCRLSPGWIEEISKYFIGNPANNAGSSSDDSVSPACSSGNIEAGRGSDNESPICSPDSAAAAGTENKFSTVNPVNDDTAADIVAGGYNFPYIENFLQACLAVCVLPVKGEILQSKYMPSSRNISFAKAAWEKAGGYPQNMDFGEDMRFNFNLKALGYRIRFNPDALVYWNMRNSAAAIFRQFFRYAKGDAVGRMYSHRHLIRFASVFLFAALISAGILISPWFLLTILLLFAAFAYRPYFRIKYFLNDKNCCVFAENKKILFFTKLKTIFCIPVMLSCIETAKLAGFIYGLFTRKNY
jgi:glycosyltransferase involved in cell wall biosynthesis